MTERWVLYINGIEIPANFEIETPMIIPTTPQFTFEFNEHDDLMDTVGLAARHLHAMHSKYGDTAFVYKTPHGHKFGYRRYLNDRTVATLTLLTDNRVRVIYNNGRDAETLYL